MPVTLPERVAAVAPGLRFVVMGGATESSIHSTIFEVDKTDPEWTSIPYGRPMANQRCYILDDAMQPVPPGVPGELYLAGTGLARGYLGQPERTAERFLTWSYGDVVRDERLYRTGDAARFGPDGLIELIGRKDFQVKIHGLRVELGEIESVLRSTRTYGRAWPSPATTGWSPTWSPRTPGTAAVSTPAP
ncbi:Amino acid adenylation domain-containing protein OS=Streptomyces tendae OX=1932 GN=GUR47_24095 PE=4 SV=1 [Streptomyces tendae]